MSRVDRCARRAQRNRALNLVLQLPHVAGPPVLREHIERFRTELDVRFPEALGRFTQEVRAQVRDFLPALAKRRHVDADDVQPVVEVFAKFSFGDALLEVRVGGCQHANIDALRPRLAERHDFVLLQKSQQLGLNVERKIANLVEEQRAAPAAAPAPAVGPPSKATAPCPNGWLSARSRPVVVQLWGGTSRRCDATHVNGARTSSFPVPLSPVMSTVRSLPAVRICSTTSHGEPAQRNPGNQGSAGGRPTWSGQWSDRAPRTAQIPARDRRNHPHRRITGCPSGSDDHEHEPRSLAVAAQRFNDDGSAPAGDPVPVSCQAARGVGVAAYTGDDGRHRRGVHVPRSSRRKRRRGCGRFAIQQLGSAAASRSAGDRIVRRDDVLAGADALGSSAPVRCRRCRARPELLKNGERLRGVTLGDGACPGLRDQAAERQMAGAAW